MDRIESNRDAARDAFMELCSAVDRMMVGIYWCFINRHMFNLHRKRRRRRGRWPGGAWTTSRAATGTCGCGGPDSGWNMWRCSRRRFQLTTWGRLLISAQVQWAGRGDEGALGLWVLFRWGGWWQLLHHVNNAVIGTHTTQHDSILRHQHWLWLINCALKRETRNDNTYLIMTEVYLERSSVPIVKILLHGWKDSVSVI